MTDRKQTRGRVAGRIALVSGAASGIGAAIAKLFVEEGARVILTDLSVDAGARHAAELGDAARFVRHDVTDEEGWRSIVDGILATEGRLDILVNNAGLGNAPHPAAPDVGLLEDWRLLNRVNGEGTFLGCKYAILAMRKSGGGSIVNMSSLVSNMPSPRSAAYGFSKAGVAQYTRTVAQFGAAEGIRCNSVHPGFTDTPILQGLMSKLERETGVPAATSRQNMVDKVPLGRLGLAIDIAYGVLYLASDEARHVTGTQLFIDGGSNLGMP